MSPLVGVASLIAVAAITPGPNNLIIMQEAAQRSLAPAVSAIVGVIVGSVVLLAIVWLSAGALFEAAPRARPILTFAGAAYLIWLGLSSAWRAGNGRSGRFASPSGWMGLAVFQLANPKAWILVLTATAAMSAIYGSWTGLFILAVVLVAITTASLAIWAVAGSALGKVLDRPRGRLWFDRLMGLALAASAVLLLI